MARLVRILAIPLLALQLPLPFVDRTVAAAPGGFVAVEVGRLLDTRAGGPTVDGEFSGGGALAPGETRSFDVVGRAGVPGGVTAVAVTVTVTEPQGPGFVTLFACGALPPTSTVNFAAGVTVANSAISGLSADGKLCVYSMTPTHVVVDVTGAFSGGFTPVIGGRLLDTRSGHSTSDGAFSGTGALGDDGVADVQVAGRLGVPADAEAVAITVTTVGSARDGYVSVYPCGDRPLASTLNHARAEVRSNSIVAPLSSTGRLCVYTLVPSHVVLDVSGYVPAGSEYTPITPARLADTRLDGMTADGACQRVGREASGTSMTLTVAGRAGLPHSGVGAVVLNVVVTGSKRPGFVTAHRRDSAVPTASMLNFAAGDTVAASVIAPIDSQGRASLFTNVGAHLVVDVVGWFPGASSASTADACAGTFVDPSQRYQRTDFPNWRFGCTLLVSSETQCWYTTMLGFRTDEPPSRLFDGELLELVGADGTRCALRIDGTVACYQGYPARAVREIPFDRPIVDIIGFQHEPGFCAIDDGGGTWCWTPAVTPDRSAPTPIPTSGRALGFVQLTWGGGPIAVRTDVGRADVVVHDGAGSFRVAGSSRDAAPGHPWSEVAAAVPHWSGAMCLTLVDGRAVCGDSPDLAPTMDVVWNDGITLRGTDGQVVWISWNEETGTFTANEPSRVLVEPSNLSECYWIGSPRADGWCQARPPG
ncbi:MAG: hypothetical protein U0Q03_00905 [Acidimicrobiales bacterium]